MNEPFALIEAAIWGTPRDAERVLHALSADGYTIVKSADENAALDAIVHGLVPMVSPRKTAHEVLYQLKAHGFVVTRPCEMEDNRIEKLEAQLEQANVTIRALVGEPNPTVPRPLGDTEGAPPSDGWCAACARKLPPSTPLWRKP